MAPIWPIPHQTHLEINKNSKIIALCCSESVLLRITFCEWLQDLYLLSLKGPHSIVCLLQSIQSRAQRMISNKFKSYLTNLSRSKKVHLLMENVLILILNDEAPRNMGYVKGSSWTNQFFCQLNMLQAFLPWARPSGRSSKSNQLGDFGHPTT